MIGRYFVSVGASSFCETPKNLLVVGGEVVTMVEQGGFEDWCSAR